MCKRRGISVQNATLIELLEQHANHKKKTTGTGIKHYSKAGKLKMAKYPV